jgi:hypothetical protein
MVYCHPLLNIKNTCNEPLSGHFMTTSHTKKITLVLGSGRSGTSVVTKALQTLGCSLGDNLSPAGPMNPKGFFEDHQIVYEINEKILASLGHAWHDIIPFDLSTPFPELSAKAESILAEKFKQASWCGFKDPRVSRLLPFWQPLLKKMAFEESYIIALRNPLSSVASFEKYEHISPNKGFLLWLTAVISAIEGTLGKNTFIVSYEEMLAHPKEQLERIHSRLNVLNPIETASIKEYQYHFLDPSLSRNQYSYEEFKNHSAAPAICIKLYDLLSLVALDKLTLESNEFKTQWNKILSGYHDFLDNFLPICASLNTSASMEKIIQELKQKISEQEQKISDKKKLIDSLLSSHSWRLMAPLRKISSYFRKEP